MPKQTKPCYRYLLCVLIAGTLLLVCTKSSPLYPLNDWVDVNIYFTIGKGLMQGRVPYLDLYDQKGPMAYLLYGLASLVSDRSFLGVYLLEALAFGTFLFVSSKTIALFTKKETFLAIPILAALILPAMSVSHGGSLEEFCLPLFALSLSSALSYYIRGYPARVAPLGMVFLNGLLAGALLFSKFTLLSFHFAWMAALFFSQCAIRRARHGLACCGVFLGGMLLVGVPWLVYFGWKHALPEFFYYYFYTNIFGYSTLEAPVAFNMLISIVRNTLATLVRNWPYAILIALGLGYLLLPKSAAQRIDRCIGLGLAREDDPCVALSRAGKLALLAMFACMPIGLYMGGQNYRYYGLVLAVFAPLGCIPLVRLFNERVAPRLSSRALRLLPALLTLAGVGVSLAFSSNTYLLGTPREETPQARFASVMRAHQNDPSLTLLCRAFPDSGFYLAADVLPFNRFFSSNNVMLPENAAEQVRLVESGAPEFVVTRNGDKSPSPRYRLLDTASLLYEDDVWTYRLYQRRGSA